MHLLWLITIATVSVLHLQLINCDDLAILTNIVGNTNIKNEQHLSDSINTITGLHVNSSLINSILNSGNNNDRSVGGAVNLGSVVNNGNNGMSSNVGLSDIQRSTTAFTTLASSGGKSGDGGSLTVTAHGHPLAGLTELGIIVPRNPGMGILDGHRMLGAESGVTNGIENGVDRNSGAQAPYYEHYISEHTIMAVFTSQGQIGGPCRFMPATRRQNHQCRKEFGLPDTIKEARRLANLHCEDQFRYDRWNCSIATRGKRNIFKKLYKETAFVHALTAAAMTHSIARACAEGRMTKCSCGPRKQNRVDQDFQWGGCNDNLKHGKRVARSFLDLRDGGGDEVTEILRHDSEVGIEAVSKLMKDKCKCHGVSGSCSMKTCWKKLSDFNATATLLRKKYNEAIRKAPNTRTMRREAATSRVKKPKQRRKKQQSQYTTLYYLETSPTYCSVTKDRQCLHPDNCANLCCGRGYTTRVFKQVEKCRCRFNNGRCCQLICDYCQRYEDRYFCK
ncbi:protein Wnt-4 [Teleopsis dalmanni]|uniref:protein Wnt-4 n=1 Tax=Teleopsis dalmanni TaxID=139649 RepID=UPI0018CED116|nr:protein Wnt-4 [Teleopsis dalmanni]